MTSPSGHTLPRATGPTSSQVRMGHCEVLWAEILDSARTPSGRNIFYLKVTTRIQIPENDKATFYVVTANSAFLQTRACAFLAGAP